MKQSRGLIAAVAAYGLWGLLPLFWKMLQHLPAQEILLHRILWSLVSVWAMLRWRASVIPAIRKLKEPKVFWTFLGATCFIAFNWFLYIWAVNAGFVLETSLGYFMTPLLNVSLGFLMLGERLRKLQWLAVSLAAIAVVVLTFEYGRLPWIGLALAISFALYGYVRKIATLGSLEGLFVETLLLSVPASAVFVWWELSGVGSFFRGAGATTLLLLLAGPVTATPLLFFAFAARNLTLSTLGLMQYIAPTLQFLLAVFVFQEPFDSGKLYAFCLIWLGLALYSYDSIRFSRQERVKKVSAIPLPKKNAAAT